jgi:hypothetical protein
MLQGLFFNKYDFIPSLGIFKHKNLEDAERQVVKLESLEVILIEPIRRQ